MTNTEPTTLPPAEFFMHLIVSFLTPMFLATAGGNITHARAAAIATINAYALRDPDDLLAIAQTIAFGLATLDSLNRSMADDLPVTLVLRLRGNAASLARAAERTRRRLPRAPAQPCPPPPEPEPDPEQERLKDEAVLANIQQVRERLNQINAGARPPQSNPAHPWRRDEIDTHAARGPLRSPGPQPRTKPSDPPAMKQRPPAGKSRPSAPRQPRKSTAARHGPAR